MTEAWPTNWKPSSAQLDAINTHEQMIAAQGQTLPPEQPAWPTFQDETWQAPSSAEAGSQSPEAEGSPETEEPTTEPESQAGPQQPASAAEPTAVKHVWPTQEDLDKQPEPVVPVWPNPNDDPDKQPSGPAWPTQVESGPYQWPGPETDPEPFQADEQRPVPSQPQPAEESAPDDGQTPRDLDLLDELVLVAGPRESAQVPVEKRGRLVRLGRRVGAFLLGAAILVSPLHDTANSHNVPSSHATTHAALTNTPGAPALPSGVNIAPHLTPAAPPPHEASLSPIGQTPQTNTLPKTFQLKPGETLWGWAEAHYPNKPQSAVREDVVEIMNANHLPTNLPGPDDLAAARDIQANTNLNVPPLS